MVFCKRVRYYVKVDSGKLKGIEKEGMRTKEVSEEEELIPF